MPYKEPNKPENIERARRSRREWYHRNKEKAKARVIERKRELQEWLREYKSRLVCSCGEDHIACLEFHHPDPAEKEIAVSQAITDGWSRERVLQEIKKCIVLCANCHRKIHHRGVA